MFFRQERAERHSGGDWLGDGDDVGNYVGNWAKLWKAKIFPVRPRPHWISSKMSAAWCWSASVRHVRRKSSEHSRLRLRQRWAPARWRKCWR